MPDHCVWPSHRECRTGGIPSMAHENRRKFCARSQQKNRYGKSNSYSSYLEGQSPPYEKMRGGISDVQDFFSEKIHVIGPVRQ